MSTLDDMGISPKPSKMYWQMTDEEKRTFRTYRKNVHITYIPSMTTIHVWGTKYIDKLPTLTRVRLEGYNSNLKN